MARRAPVSFTLLVAASLPGLAAAAPAARCAAERAASRALVTVVVEQLFDDDLLRLVRLGLVGTIRLQATLVRPRPLWFDERRATVTRTAAVTWDRRQAVFRVDDRPVSGVSTLTFPTLPLRPEGEMGAGPHHVELSARLEVVTASSLGQVARWLAQPGQAGEPQALPRTLAAYLAADLARTANARCDVR